MLDKIYNFKYSAMQGTYWLIYAVIGSFASVFLLDKGYTNGQIGMILALGNLVTVVLQPFVSDFCDRSKKVSIFGVVGAITLAMAILMTALFFFDEAGFGLSFVYVSLIGWMGVVQPLLTSIKFKIEEYGIFVNFGLCRAFGSFTYAILCVILGWLVERRGVGMIPVTGEFTVIAFALSLVIMVAKIKKDRVGLETISSVENNSEESEITLVEFVGRHKLFFLLMIGVLGVYFTNQTLNNFMLQIVTNVGGTAKDMGMVFTILALLEIPTMMFFDRLRERFSCQSMVKFASLCYTLEILICHLAPNVEVIMAAQVLQLFSFGLFMPSMVHMINEIMDRGEAVKGQGLYIMVTTITSIISAVIGGMVIDLSGVHMLTLLSTVITGAGALMVIFTVDKVKNER